MYVYIHFLDFIISDIIPGIVGCLDCTHVAIKAPSDNDQEIPEYLFVNYINAQLVSCTAYLSS